jgi:hypothetical protein
MLENLLHGNKNRKVSEARAAPLASQSSSTCQLEGFDLPT